MASSFKAVIPAQEGRTLTYPTLCLLLAAMMFGCSSVPITFTPSRPLAPGAFSHRLFNDVLKAHVHDGRVNYPALKTDGRLMEYLEQLDRIDPNGLSTNERLALWINAYNAYTIKGILDGYSPSTLVGRYQFFINRTYRIGGETVNLYDLERKILIAQFHEPRIHFAIVCASFSCPKLQPWAYEGAQLDRQLDRVAQEFINDPTKNQFNRMMKVAYLSRIFDWFTEDFEAQAGSLPLYAARYVQDPDLVQELKTTPYRVEFLDYDWSLNGPLIQR